MVSFEYSAEASLKVIMFKVGNKIKGNKADIATGIHSLIHHIAIHRVIPKVSNAFESAGNWLLIQAKKRKNNGPIVLKNKPQLSFCISFELIFLNDSFCSFKKRLNIF